MLGHTLRQKRPPLTPQSVHFAWSPRGLQSLPNMHMYVLHKCFLMICGHSHLTGVNSTKQMSRTQHVVGYLHRKETNPLYQLANKV